ncbi:MAG: OmpH family outer membrane protein [Phycisphaerales bacterium]
MNTFSRFSGSKLALAAACGLAVVAGLELRSLARPEAAPEMAAPTVVGLVDLERLMNGLEELASLNSALNGRKDALQGQLNDIKKQMEAIDNDLKNNIAESDVKARTEKLAQKFELEALYEARGKAFQRLIDLENGDIIKALYEKATVAVTAFAQKNGIDLVMLDDRAIGFRSRASVKEVNSIIESKRVLFAGQQLDITDRILDLMNNEFRAGINVGKNGKP